MSKLSRQLKTIANSWAPDPFRPNMQLQTFLTALADHPKLTPNAVHAAMALQNGEIEKKVCFSVRNPNESTTDGSHWGLQYPLSERMLKPASKPLHYSQVVEGFQKSAQGIARPRWKQFFGIW